MKKIFMLFAAMAVTVVTMAANQPVGNKNKQKAPKQEQLSEWQKAAAAWGGKAQAAKSNSLLQGSIVLEPVTPDLSNNTLPSFTSLNLPYSGEVAWAPMGTIKVPAMGYSTAAAMGFTFNVSEGKGVHIAFGGSYVYCVLASSQTLTDESQIRWFGPSSSILIREELMAITPVSGEWTSGALAAGAYTLFVVYDPSFTGTFDLSLVVEEAEPVEMKSYADLDYSTVLNGKKVYGALGQGEGDAIDPQSLMGAPFEPVGRGYTLTLEQGKTYNLNFTMYNEYGYAIRRAAVDYVYGLYPALLKNTLTGNLNEDVIPLEGYPMPYDSDLLENFVSPISGTVKLLLFCPVQSEFVYTLELEEVELDPEPEHVAISNPSDFEIVDIEVPYICDSVVFTPDNTCSFGTTEENSYSERARAFRFTLDVPGTLSVYASSNYLDWSAYISICRQYSAADGFYGTAYSKYFGSGDFYLAAGTYYLLLDDDGYMWDKEKNYSCQLKVSFISDEICEQEALDLEDLLEKAQTVTYASDLFFMGTGNFACGEALLGTHMSGSYYFDYDYYGYSNNAGDAYCAVYKVSLKAGDKLYVNHHGDFDEFLYLYKYEDGDLVLMVYDDDDDDYIGYGYGLRGSYLEFTAEADGDYYIVATTYGEKRTGDFAITISAINPEDWSNEITALIASASSVEVEDINNLGEILVKLSELKVYGLISSDAKLPLENYVGITSGNWQISEDRTTATYTISYDDAYYHNFAENIEPLVITIMQGSGISNVGDDDNISVFAAAGVINVIGAPEGTAVKVFSVMGAQVAAAKSAGELTTLNIPNSGVYIVLVGNKAFKVLAQ